MKKTNSSNFKKIILLISSVLAFSLNAQSEITRASKRIGHIQFDGGANRIYTGSAYLIDETSFQVEGLHECNWNNRVSLVTANHVLQMKNLGEKVAVYFPYHEFDESFQPKIEPKITVRDIVSDLALASLSSADKSKLSKLPFRARPQCVGLGGGLLTKASKLSLVGFETGSYLSTSTSASIRSISPGQSLSLKKFSNFSI